MWKKHVICFTITKLHYDYTYRCYACESVEIIFQMPQMMTAVGTLLTPL
jgi:hypothetical protein